MMFGDKKRRSLHWAEAFGASAVVHVGLAILAFDLIPEFDLTADDEPELIIETILIDGDLLADLDVPVSNLPDADPFVEPEPDPDPVPAPPPPPEVDPAPEVVPEPVPEPQVEPDPEPVPDLEPQIAEAANIESEALAPVTESAAAAPVPLSPLRPEDGALIPVAPVATAVPLPPTSAGTSLSANPVQAIAPVAQATAVQPLQTLQAPPPTQAPPSPQGEQARGPVNELVRRIRGRLTETCLIGIPRQSGDGATELVTFGADETSIQSFANAVLADIAPEPGRSTVLVDNRQCAALNFVRENRDYPGFRLSISLDQVSIDSGDDLTGTVGNTAGRYVSLLLVDDNGVVQDLGSYLTFTNGAARFEVPMRRDGNARDTSQTIVALATNARPNTLNTENGKLAEEFFPALRAELGPSTPLVLVAFDVR